MQKGELGVFFLVISKGPGNFAAIHLTRRNFYSAPNIMDGRMVKPIRHASRAPIPTAICVRMTIGCAKNAKATFHHTALTQQKQRRAKHAPKRMHAPIVRRTTPSVQPVRTGITRMQGAPAGHVWPTASAAPPRAAATNVTVGTRL